MPLDHFVSQVHLKNFYSPVLGKRMFALRKTDMKAFTPDAYSVCRIPDGSTNQYLSEPRAIEDFLKDIEPNYNRALADIVSDKVCRETVFVLAGFIAYVLTCSPGGMRMHSEPHRGAVAETARLLDKTGEFGTPPPELSGGTLTELLDSNRVQVQVDPKYPQAMGISSIHERTNAFGNFRWEVLINDWKDSPFFTSDFPVAIEHTKDRRIINRLVPLSPTLAVRIHPDLSYDQSAQDFTFPGFRRIVRRPTYAEVARINRLLVQCAESTVFFRDNHDWVERLVRANATFRIEPHTDRLPYGTCTLLVSSLQVARQESSTGA